MKTLKEVQKLSKRDLKNVMGGTAMPPAGCSCFCFIGSVKTSHACNTYCPGGVVPGVNVGSPAGCGTPPQLP